MTRLRGGRTSGLLAAAIGLLVAVGSPPPAAAHPCDSPRGAGRGRGMGPPWAGDGRCPAGGEMPVVPFPEAELPDAGSPGAAAFTRHCAQCHALPSPRAHSAEEWEATLSRMIRRMEHVADRRHAGRGRWMPPIVAPTTEEARRLRDYLKAHALATAPAELEAEDRGEGGRSFAAVCATCHALPDPARHSVAEWPRLVERMEGNMDRMGVARPDPQTRAAILAFLRAHASE